MASLRHDFIVAAIARKMRQYGYEIVYHEGRSGYFSTESFAIPPKILNHRPDLIGKSNSSYCIGEAKTENDLSSKRSKQQLLDFVEFVRMFGEGKLIVGMPSSVRRRFEKLLEKLGLYDDAKVEIVYVPNDLLPDEKDI